MASHQLRYRFRYYFGNNTQNIDVNEINQVIETTKQINIKDNLIINQVCHILLFWELNGKNHGNGLVFLLTAHTWSFTNDYACCLKG